MLAAMFLQIATADMRQLWASKEERLAKLDADNTTYAARISQSHQYLILVLWACAA